MGTRRMCRRRSSRRRNGHSFLCLTCILMWAIPHYPRRIFHPTRPSAEPNEGDFSGGVSLGLRDARSGLFALVRKEVFAEYGKTQSHKGNGGFSGYCLGESSDFTSRPRSSLDGEVDLCHSNSRVGK